MIDFRFPAIRRRCRRAVAVVTLSPLALLALLQSPPVTAQEYPARAVTMIFPFPPGGSGDTASRAIAADMAKTLKQPVIIENRAGGGGMQGALAVKNGRPDGYLVSYLHIGIAVIRPSADTSFAFEPGRDYAPVALTWEVWSSIVANPGAPFRDMKGLLAYARANPGKLNMAVGGVGSVDHVTGNLLKQAAGIDFQLIPHNGAAPATAAVLGGHIEAAMLAINLEPQAASGKLVRLATASPKRLAGAPDWPTVAESGVPGFAGITSWVGVFAAPGTPRDIIMKLNGAINAALNDPATRARVQNVGAPTGGTPEQALAKVREDLAGAGPIIRKLGLKFD